MFFITTLSTYGYLFHVEKGGRTRLGYLFRGASEFLVMPLRATQHLMPNVIVEMQNLQSQS